MVRASSWVRLEEPEQPKNDDDDDDRADDVQDRIHGCFSSKLIERFVRSQYRPSSRRTTMMTTMAPMM